MPKQIRGTISEEANEILKAACAEGNWSIGEVISTALIKMYGQEDTDGKLDAILAQQQYLLKVLMHLMHQNGWALPEEELATERRPVEDPDSSSNGITVASYEDMYGARTSWNSQAEEPVPEDFRQALPKRSLLTRMLYKGTSQ